MKKLFILVFLSITFFTNAQETKPTKQETIDYITNYILKADNSLLTQVTGKTESYSEIIYHTIEDFSINGSIVKIKRSRKTHYNNWKRNINEYNNQYSGTMEIDLSKVDKIYCIPLKNDDGSTVTCSYISFHRAEDGPTSIGKPITVVGEIDENAQIYKAFNHLRKLCGAPEPIKF